MVAPYISRKVLPKYTYAAFIFVNEHCHKLIMKPFTKSRIYQKLMLISFKLALNNLLSISKYVY